ncbi:MAG: hypothetical protein IJV71_09185, partial [Lachnospiraceae bacterium]|nr:hypothetical protein [Lachnospiraceae bacterium]
MGVTPGKYFEEAGNSLYSFTNGFTSNNFYGNSGTEEKFLSHTRYYDAPNYGYRLDNVAEEGHGNVLTVYKSETASQMCLIHFPIADATEDDANCVVFETDFLYTGADLYYNKETDTSTGTFYISVNSTAFSDTAGKTWNQLSKTYQGEFQTIDLDGVKVKDETAGTYKSEKGTNAIRLPGSTTNLEANKWYNICLEIYTDVDKYIL